MNTATPSEHPSPEISEVAWSGVVDRIQRGDPTGMEDLYQVFSKGVRFFLYRQLGPHDLDDKVHDVFLIVAQSIRKGDLREPDRLMGYVRTVVRRQVAAHIEDAIRARKNHTDLEGTLVLSDRKPDPERGAIEHQNEELAMRILNSISKRDREVLVRFYLDEQSPDQICHAMKLTETQFRLIKSRAKARFGELGKRRFSLRNGFRR
ncbi:MAG: sigma-70 family RNA polymerase sigma factor [Terriglobia bacterium]|nr:MAG: sigma-70 family RNA polymerase sigma factor [Terriglobia bacterium]